MTKRWSLKVWNDWRYVRRNMIDVTLLRVNFDYLDGYYFSVDVVVLGFGVGMNRYPNDSATLVESLGREHADGSA